MKGLVTVLIIAGLVFSLALPACAASHETTYRPMQKLGRGVANVVTSPFELPKGMGDASAERGAFAGLTWGILQGTVNIVKRAAVGVYEIATFPLPIPKNYEPILEEPEFFLQKRTR